MHSRRLVDGALLAALCAAAGLRGAPARAQVQGQGQAPGAAPAAAPASAAAAVDELLAQILTAVSRQPLRAAPFIERRMSGLASKPLESRGTLSYEPSGRIEKRTTTPISELVVLTADTIEISSGTQAPTVIRFATRPELAGYAVALRAVLSGDTKPLRAHFQVQASGSLTRWELKLAPIEPAMKRAIRQVAIAGENGQLRLIETTELSGDTDELTLLVK